MGETNFLSGARRKFSAPLYDTLLIEDGNTSSEYVLFGHSAGTDGIQKTNMITPYQLPPEQRFICHAIRFVNLTFGKADLLNLMQNYALRFLRSGSNIEEIVAGIEYFSAGAGIVGTAATTATTTTIEAWQNGVPDPNAVARLDTPIVISGNDVFRVSIVGKSYAQAVDGVARVYLDGEWEKGV